jgi:hypothetical protein
MDVDVVQRIKSISRETSDDYHWFETAIRDARLWGIISVIALAIAFSRRSANSDAAVWIFLLLAAVMAVLMVNTLRVVRMSLYRTPITIFSAMCLLPLFALAGYWLTVPVSQSTETRTSSPTPISGQVFVSSPTPATIIQATPLSSPLRSSAPGDNPLLSFDRTILIKGGSVHRLDALMTAAGYKGSLLLQTLYIYNKDEGGAEICWGDQPNVDPTTGGCVPSGDGYNFPGGRDARQVYLMAKKDMRLYISALSR